MLDDNAGGKNLKDKTEDLVSKKELQAKISKKKAELAPILKEVKAVRESIDVSESFRYKRTY